MAEFSHLDANGQANMVDVSGKGVTTRIARAEAYVYMKPETFTKLANQELAKGDVFAVARVAGIQAAKRCADLIPLCHPLALSKVAVEFEMDESKSRVRVETLCKLDGKTGVEMEALTAASVASLTIFDMCKALEPTMRIEGLRVLSKEGGKSGDWSVDDNG